MSAAPHAVRGLTASPRAIAYRQQLAGSPGVLTSIRIEASPPAGAYRARMNYATRVLWTGNKGEGTASYTGYERAYRIEVRDKPELEGSSDPAFRGDPRKHNPEDLFLAAISSCHMLFYLSLCAKHGIRVIDYVDDATATMQLDSNGGGRFVEVTLHPVVTIASGDVDRAFALHEDAHDRCFIANSCHVPIHHEATIHVASEVRA